MSELRLRRPGAPAAPPELSGDHQPRAGGDVEEAEERNALPRLRRGELDLVLIERDEHTLPAAPRGMVDIPLLDESWLVVVPAEQAAPSTLADLARATWIDLAPGTAAPSPWIVWSVSWGCR